MNPCPLVLETTVLTKLNYSPFYFKNRMLTKYFEEIKNRLILIIISGSINVLTCYIYKETLLFLTFKTFINTYQNNNSTIYLISTTITEIFSSYIKLSYFISIQFTIIVFFYHFTSFLAPGLYEKEYKKLKKIIFISILTIIINILLFHNFILPFLWNFFLNFQNSFQNKPINIYFEGKFNEYLNFYITNYIIIILIINLFLTQFIMIDKIDNKNTFIQKYRKIFYLIFILTATIITPPDIISQLFLLILFTTLFELNIFFTIFKKNYILIRKPIKT